MHLPCLTRLADMQIRYDASYSPAQGTAVMRGLSEATAKAKPGMSPVQPFGFFLEDDAGHVIGGAIGAILYGSIHTDMLWVDEHYRGQGWGKRLMAEAESLGKMRHCTFATVTTMDWEALPFYQQLGYSIEFTRTGYENNSTMFLLRKNFS